MNFPPTQNFLESSVNQGEDDIVLSIVESQYIWHSIMALIYAVILSMLYFNVSTFVIRNVLHSFENNKFLKNTF